MHEFEVSRPATTGEVILFCKKCGESYVLSHAEREPVWRRLSFTSGNGADAQPAEPCTEARIGIA